MKNNKIVLTLILVLTIGIVGLTIAYFANSSTINNIFNTNPYGTTVTEEFVSPDNWLPGTSTDKSLTVTNTGQVDEAVRISYIESWTSRSAKNNDEEGDLPLSQNGNTAALIHFTNTDDWTTVTENGTIYRYYNYKLAPSATTSELLDYVTFNPAITNSSNCTTTESNGTKTITCNSTGNGYDDATYKLTFTIETVQYNKYKEAWGTNVNIASMKPMNARELALKSNPVSVTNYTDGNVHEMYTFNHEATEQTPALTDYRYIGNNPYNYVYFNCDDLNNQNSETCEVWRIIGVFDVERPDPNDNTKTITERRMKLVSNSGFGEWMEYDSESDENVYTGNDWPKSDLNIFLNDDYYNKSGDAVSYGLKSTSRVMIDDAKYYLGAIDWDQQYGYGEYFGSVDDFYNAERGSNVFDSSECYSECISNHYRNCNTRCEVREKSWTGKIAFMYVSDVFMIYANGISTIMYNNPTKYDGENVRKNWLYTEKATWLMPNYAEDETVFAHRSDGVLRYQKWGSSGINFYVRPTLYLSSSVKIIDGDGSINNPYKLSNS